MSVEFKIDPLVSIDQGLLIGNIPSGTISGPTSKEQSIRLLRTGYKYYPQESLRLMCVF